MYARLRREIDAAKPPSSAAAAIVSNAAASALPYLHACIREGLRMWPPAASTFDKIVPAGGVVAAGGVRVPGGTHIGLSPVSVQQNRAVFGADADSFRPERWLEAEEAAAAAAAAGPGVAADAVDRLAHMERDHALVFAYGRFSCLGVAVAMMELRKVIFEVSRM